MTYFSCGSCGSRIQSDLEEVGSFVDCPGCHLSVAVPNGRMAFPVVATLARFTLIQAGFVIGPIMAFCSILALYSCLMQPQWDFARLAFDLLVVGYGLILAFFGAATALFEWNQKYEIKTGQQKFTDDSMMRRKFAILCLVYGGLAGMEFCKPSLLATVLGMVLGVVSGFLGAGYCSIVLNHRVGSRHRRVHACIFVSVCSLFFSVFADKLLWRYIG